MYLLSVYDLCSLSLILYFDKGELCWKLKYVVLRYLFTVKGCFTDSFYIHVPECKEQLIPNQSYCEYGNQHC